MRLAAALVGRELRRAWGSGGAPLAILFFLLVATLFPFAIGPDPLVLGRAGGGLLWTAALLAALLPVERLVAPDLEAGVIDQLAVRGVAEESVAAAKLVGHWLAFGPGLLLATLPAAALLRIDGGTLWRLLAALAIGTPALAGLGVMTAALTAGLRGAGALAGLLMLPLAVPVLIFGAGALDAAAGGALAYLAAVSLLLTGIAPIAAGAAMRAAREG